MERSILLVIRRFTEQKQSFIMKRRMGRKLNFVVQNQDMATCFGTNDMGFQLPRKVVLLGA